MTYKHDFNLDAYSAIAVHIGTDDESVHLYEDLARELNIPVQAINDSWYSWGDPRGVQWVDDPQHIVYYNLTPTQADVLMARLMNWDEAYPHHLICLDDRPSMVVATTHDVWNEVISSYALAIDNRFYKEAN